MTLSNCPKCGKLFARQDGQVLCGECRRGENQDFQALREYVYEHPGCTVRDLVENLDIPRRVIFRYINEGRLLIGPATKEAGRCVSCGGPVVEGRICGDCAQSISRSARGPEPLPGNSGP